MRHKYEEFMNEGLVPGQNINQIYYNRKKENKFDDDGNPIETEEDDEGFEGALVGDPTLIEHFGMKLFDKKSRSVFKYSIDLFESIVFFNSLFFLVFLSISIFPTIPQFELTGWKYLCSLKVIYSKSALI